MKSGKNNILSQLGTSTTKRTGKNKNNGAMFLNSNNT